jgi:hypothetical protein
MLVATNICSNIPLVAAYFDWLLVLSVTLPWFCTDDYAVYVREGWVCNSAVYFVSSRQAEQCCQLAILICTLWLACDSQMHSSICYCISITNLIDLLFQYWIMAERQASRQAKQASALTLHVQNWLRLLALHTSISCYHIIDDWHAILNQSRHCPFKYTLMDCMPFSWWGMACMHAYIHTSIWEADELIMLAIIPNHDEQQVTTEATYCSLDWIRNACVCALQHMLSSCLQKLIMLIDK